MVVSFHIDNNLSAVRPELDYVLKRWAHNASVSISYTDQPGSGVTIGTTASRLCTQSFPQPGTKVTLNRECLIDGPHSAPDYLGTAFYMLNSLQEYADTDPDDLGRFRYRNSYQHRFRNAKENIVQHCFDEISRTAGVSPRNKKTCFLLTHDIDVVYGAILEDGFNVLKRGRIDLFFQLLFNHAIGRPDWLNMDKIMKLESDYDCKSLFFWIVNKGRLSKRERNADYNFASPKIRHHRDTLERGGWETGIHKSISAESFHEEFVKFGRTPFANRYHYLKFRLPEAYHDIADAGLKLDASLGFAEEPGFRNSYGLPFNPYNFQSRAAFPFVEVPLTMMDATWFQYKKSAVPDIEREIFDFFERTRYNCVLSVLWHNNFFSNYKFKGYLGLYKKILEYIHENKFYTLSQEAVVKTYGI